MLVQVPWQPECWLTPDTLSYLVAASNRIGTELYINGSDGAWRAYAEQKRLYDLYLSGQGNVASNPDTGQRNHMRGAAFDLFRTDDEVQSVCRAVGLVRDADESWHWNNPNWVNMPIIKENLWINNRTDDDEMLSSEAQTFIVDTVNAAVGAAVQAITSSTNDVKNAVRREGRGRLYYCPKPPRGLPQFVVIFWDRSPGQKNVLYCNAGETQARNLMQYYFQTSDSVEQAKAAAITNPKQFATLINLALGVDSSFNNISS